MGQSRPVGNWEGKGERSCQFTVFMSCVVAVVVAITVYGFNNLSRVASMLPHVAAGQDAQLLTAVNCKRTRCGA